MAAVVSDERRAAIEAWRKRTGSGWRAAAKAFPDVPANTIKSWFTRNARWAERGAPGRGGGAPHGAGAGGNRSAKEGGKSGENSERAEAPSRARTPSNADLPAAPALVRAGRIAVALRMLWLADKNNLTSKDQLKIAMTMKATIEALPGALSQATDTDAMDEAGLEDELAAAMGVDPEALRHAPLRAVAGGKA